MRWRDAFKGLRGARLRLAIGIAILVVILAGCDFLVAHHSSFGIDGTPGFAAWYGLLAAAVAIGLATGWARLARRPETAAEREGRDG